ncbi:UNVERIFIED_ORG: hypothetical protein M2193_003578 [Bradyrhizobium japonicum]
MRDKVATMDPTSGFTEVDAGALPLARPRTLAASINDRDAAAKIEALAEEYKRRAGALSASKEAEAHKGLRQCGLLY